MHVICNSLKVSFTFDVFVSFCISNCIACISYFVFRFDPSTQLTIGGGGRSGKTAHAEAVLPHAPS